MAKSKEMPASVFKAKCLSVMERVRETGEEVVITKHGKPVAKLVPFAEERAKPFIGRNKGMTLYEGDVMSPIDVEWEAWIDPPDFAQKPSPKKKRT